MNPLSAIDIENYLRNGVVCLRNVLDGEWIEALAEAIDADIKNPGPMHYGYEGDGSFHGNQEIWQCYDACRQYCLNSPLPELAKQLLDSETITFYFDHLFVKEPGSISLTPWHNDQPFWPIGGDQVVSFWTSLDRVTRESGAVEYVKGSHRWGRWFQPRSFGPSKKGYIGAYDENVDYEPIPDIDGQRDVYDIVSFDTAPGDLIAFSALTVHGAGANNSDRRRRGYAIRYGGDDVFYEPRTGVSPLLLMEDMKVGESLDSVRHPRVI